jgi:tRNA(Ile)-lysidine synthase
VELHKARLLEIRGDEIHIPVLKLKKAVPLQTIVYEIIHEFGFSPGQVEEVMRLLDSGSGKYIVSSTHRILKNRNWLILSPHREAAEDNILIEGVGESVCYAGGELQLRLVAAAKGETDKSIALLDAAAIQFPLLLRKWRRGDYFYPLGLRKKKKLGRFFIDNKLSLADKEKVWVLEMDKKIVWVVGWRIDDRFKIGPETKQILEIRSKT